MRWLILAGAFVAPHQAFAGAATAENCDFFQPRSWILECDVTNEGDTALASLRYGVRYVEATRSVPWAEWGYDDAGPNSVAVPGGIEPGETVRVKFLGPEFPAQADPDKVDLHLELLGAVSSDGVVLE